MQTGAIYFITILNNTLPLNLPVISISSEMVWGFIIYPTRIQVNNATIGIMTLLLIKSNIHLPDDPAIPLLGICPREMETSVHT